MDAERYLALFVSEARDHLGAAWDCLARLGDAPASGDAARELMRHAHSLKGMAATMGFEPLADLAHALEDVFEARAEGDGAADPGRLVREALSCLDRGVDAAERRIALDGDPPRELARALRGLAGAPDPGPPGTAEATTARHATAPPEATRWRVELTLDTDGVSPLLAALRGVAALGTIEHVDPPLPTPPGAPRRVGLHLRARREPDGLRAALAAVPGVREVHAAAPAEARPAAPLPAAPQRLARVRCSLLDDLHERTVDLILEHGRARAAVAAGPGGDAEAHLERAAAIVRDLYATVSELRLVPFSDEAHRLRRAVHELARALGRPAGLVVDGGATRVDRSVLDALADPLHHALRNALDHGVEDPAGRVAAGKPEEARLTVRVARATGWLRVEVADDGRGIDVEAVRRRAVEAGLVSATAAGELDDRATRLLVAEPGFSTAPSVGRVSGRGVGMDVVRDAVERLGGRLEIDSTPGVGTVVRLLVPTDVTLVRALLVRGGTQLFAVPLAGMLRATAPTPSTVPLPVALAAACRVAAPPRTDAPAAALVVERPGGPIELGVSEIVGRRRVVVRPLHAPLDRLACYAGAALLDDGRIALVLDPYRL